MNSLFFKGIKNFLPYIQVKTVNVCPCVCEQHSFPQFTPPTPSTMLTILSVYVIINKCSFWFCLLSVFQVGLHQILEECFWVPSWWNTAVARTACPLLQIQQVLQYVCSRCLCYLMWCAFWVRGWVCMKLFTCLMMTLNQMAVTVTQSRCTYACSIIPCQ
jgi:hypothetical protein